MKKRLLVSLVAGTVVFGSVFAFAASLNGVSSDNLGADDSVVASCDTDGVSVDYDPAYDATSARYEVLTVNVSGITAAIGACDGQTVTVALANSAGAKIGDGNAVVGATSVAVPINESPAAEDVTHVHVVIAQASSSPPVG